MTKLEKGLEDAKAGRVTEFDFKKFTRERNKYKKEYPILSKIESEYWHMSRIIDDIKDFVKSNWFFLIHGFYPIEWWSYDVRNAKRAVKLLKYFKKHTHIDYTCFKDYRVFWKALDEIIKGFEIIANDKYIQPFLINNRLPRKKHKVARKWNEEHKVAIQNYYRAQRALKLYAKYYFWLKD